MSLVIVPIEFDEACAFVAANHRHHEPPVGHKFSIACADGAIKGVAIVGRPVGRRQQDGWTLEVTRLATDGTRNACSILYRAAWRATKAMGYTRLITFTLIGQRRGGSWSVPSRPRVDTHPLQGKLLWECTA